MFCIFVLESQPFFKTVKQDKNDDENFNQLWEVKMFGASLREQALGRRQSFGENRPGDKKWNCLLEQS